ncbi:EamA family transporter RarD [Naumannella huperziae]
MAKQTPAAPAESGAGVLAAIGAYAIWGLVPLFWPLLNRSQAVELLAHRIVWAFVVAAVIALIIARRPLLRTLRNRRAMLLLSAAAVVISVNWGVYIWAVTHAEVVQASLGYYINPILSILAGVLVLRERLAPAQWAAIGLAFAAVIVLTIDYGHPPWIALTLATSFATYGVLKKFAPADPIVTLVIESGVVLIPATAYLGWLAARGVGSFGTLGPGYDALLICAGVVTVIPLLCFAWAAPRIRLSTMGMTQYLAPTLQFILGVAWFGEPMSPARWAGFVLVWIALSLLTGYAIVVRRRARKARAG